MRALCVLLLSLVLMPRALAQEAARGERVDVLGYAARIEIDFEARSLEGRVNVSLSAPRARTTTIVLDAGDLTIEAVREDGAVRLFMKDSGRLMIELPPKPAADRYSVEIDYRGSPKRGLSFAAEERAVYTEFSTEHWLPCVAAPDERATFDLMLVVPADFAVTATGRHTGDFALPGGRLESRWSLDRPMPSYLFGFAAGRFNVARAKAGDVDLVYVGPSRWSKQQLRKVFAATADMLEFFALRAGKPFPGASYTQVLVPRASGQELADIAVLGERYGDGVLADPTAIWLGAHEAAHQWWGNSVTNESWNQFWLNEGIGTFMTAAYLEHRFGRDEYLRQIGAARKKYEALLAEGRDRPLVFDDWSKPTSADRSIVYDKGAYVVHLLREELGDEAFWKGMELYTVRYWGRSVTTEDFQSAMEEASGRHLGDFFSHWALGR